MTTRLTQTVTDMGGPVPGDCWRTAIACLLGLADPAEVPHFIHEHDGMTVPDRWWHATVEWVEAYLPGWTLGGYDPTFPLYDSPHAPPHVIASGPSPRGPWLHSVVVDARTGALVWDPHPSRAGLAGPPVDLAALITRTDREDQR